MGIIKSMRGISLFLFTALIFINAYADGSGVKLRFETWDVPRHGEVLLKVPELATIVEQWSESQGHRIELRYPGGEEGELWVEELADWLVSLGIPSRVIQLSPGSDAEDVINIVLIKVIKNNE